MSLAVVVQETYIYFYVSYVTIHIATSWNDVHRNIRHSVMPKPFTTYLCSIFNFTVPCSCIITLPLHLLRLKESSIFVFMSQLEVSVLSMFLKILACVYKATWCHFQEGPNLDTRLSENLRLYIIFNRDV
jgi:hypothetical protein